MMGRQVAQGSLFYGFRLDDHVPADQLLRRIDGLLDFGFVREAVADSRSIQPPAARDAPRTSLSREGRSTSRSQCQSRPQPRTARPFSTTSNGRAAPARATALETVLFLLIYGYVSASRWESPPKAAFKRKEWSAARI